MLAFLISLALSLGGVTVTAPSWGNPAGPGEPATLTIRADVPAASRAEVTIRTDLGIAHPLCRPVDAPDPEFRGWLVCGTDGPWSLTLTIPRATLASPACPVSSVPIPYTVSMDGRRLGEGFTSIVMEACYRAYVPMLRTP